MNHPLVDRRRDVFITAGVNQSLVFWTVKPIKILEQFEQAHSDSIYSVTKLDDCHVASAGSDQIIKIWDLEMRRCALEMAGHGNTVFRVTPVGRPDLLASCSFDRTVRLWDIANATEGGAIACTTLQGHTKCVRDICCTPSLQLASASWDGTIRLWDIESERCVLSLRKHFNRVTTVESFSTEPDCSSSSSSSISSHLLLSAGEDKRIYLWDPSSSSSSHKPIECLKCHRFPITCLKLLNSTSNPYLLISTDVTGRILLWDLRKMEVIRGFLGHEGAIHSVVPVRGRMYGTAGDDHYFRIWRVGKGDGDSDGIDDGSGGGIGDVEDAELAFGGSDFELEHARSGKMKDVYSHSPVFALCLLPRLERVSVEGMIRGMGGDDETEAEAEADGEGEEHDFDADADDAESIIWPPGGGAKGAVDDITTPEKGVRGSKRSSKIHILSPIANAGTSSASGGDNLASPKTPVRRSGRGRVTRSRTAPRLRAPPRKRGKGRGRGGTRRRRPGTATMSRRRRTTTRGRRGRGRRRPSSAAVKRMIVVPERTLLQGSALSPSSFGGWRSASSAVAAAADDRPGTGSAGSTGAGSHISVEIARLKDRSALIEQTNEHLHRAKQTREKELQSVKLTLGDRDVEIARLKELLQSVELKLGQRESRIEVLEESQREHEATIREFREVTVPGLEGKVSESLDRIGAQEEEIRKGGEIVKEKDRDIEVLKGRMEGLLKQNLRLRRELGETGGVRHAREINFLHERLRRQKRRREGLERRIERMTKQSRETISSLKLHAATVENRAISKLDECDHLRRQRDKIISSALDHLTIGPNPWTSPAILPRVERIAEDVRTRMSLQIERRRSLIEDLRGILDQSRQQKSLSGLKLKQNDRALRVLKIRLQILDTNLLRARNRERATDAPGAGAGGVSGTGKDAIAAQMQRLREEIVKRKALGMELQKRGIDRSYIQMMEKEIRSHSTRLKEETAEFGRLGKNSVVAALMGAFLPLPCPFFVTRLPGRDASLAQIEQHSFLSSKIPVDDSKYFVRLHGVLEDPQSKEICLVSERCPESLQDLMLRPAKLSLRRKFALLLELASALSTLHRHRRVHLDLRPSVVGVWWDATGQRVKLSGFEMAVSMEEDGGASSTHVHETLRGDPIYTDVNIVDLFLKREPDAFLTTRDVYSFGIIAFELILDDNPFSLFTKMHFRSTVFSSEALHEYLAVRKDESIFELICRDRDLSRFPLPFLNLVRSCLDPRDHQRPSFVDLVPLLASLQELDFDDFDSSAVSSDSEQEEEEGEDEEDEPNAELWDSVLKKQPEPSLEPSEPNESKEKTFSEF